MRQNLGTALTVTATEKWLAAVQSGQAFGQFASQNAVAAQFSYVQLFNPAASGKTLLLRAVVRRRRGHHADRVVRAARPRPGAHDLLHHRQHSAGDLVSVDGDVAWRI